jgi:hypothetical protein
MMEREMKKEFLFNTTDNVVPIDDDGRTMGGNEWRFIDVTDQVSELKDRGVLITSRYDEWAGIPEGHPAYNEALAAREHEAKQEKTASKKTAGKKASGSEGKSPQGKAGDQPADEQ